MDLPVATVLTWAIVAWLEQRDALASALLCAAALMKIPAPLTVPLAFAVLLVVGPKRRRSASAWASVFAPFAIVAIWLAYHESVAGWLIARPGRTIASPHDVTTWARCFGAVGSMLLLDQWRWILPCAALGATLLRIAQSKTMAAGPILPHLAIVASGWLFFATVGEFGPRYGIYLLPSYLVATLYVVRAGIPHAARFSLVAAGIFCLFITGWHPRRPLTTNYSFAPDCDLAYLDMIAIGQQSARWLARKFPDAEIYGAQPESYQLTEPWQGYVDIPRRFASCRAFEFHSNVTQIVYVHPYHPRQLQCRELVQSLGARLIRHFEANGKWLELYLIPVQSDHGGSSE
jgi:hypothetical protein